MPLRPHAQVPHWRKPQLKAEQDNVDQNQQPMELQQDQEGQTGGDGNAQTTDPNAPKDDRFYYFWDRFCARPKYPKTSTTPSLDADEEGVPTHKPGRNKEGVVTSQKASTSYAEAAAACKSKVQAIVAECSRLNVKYYDRAFDVEDSDALQSLEAELPYSMKGLAGVQSVKRIEDIFEKPQFYEDGATANDVCQGTVGDCWFLAAITALSGKPELLQRICVARDEKVGVYGFVFYRDGEWISEVVDDRLCLRQNDDKWSYTSEYMVTTDGRKPLRDLYPLQPGEYSLSRLPKEFREKLRKGSDALYFSSCRSKNETWLPLLEKAYAKAHGDYQAIEGGFPGEGIEDLTGGVATYLYSEHVLDKDKLWSELLQVNKNFLFGCGSRYGRDSDPQDDEGFVRGHAYSVLEAREINDLKLLKIRNPWGSTEWNGAWSDGSKEWTPEMMKELGHTFGDDGIFWISYKDFLKFYPEIDRTRLFDDSWTVTQQWTSVEVPWTADYLSTKFSLTLTEKSPVVLVLSQPDDRYFQGLTGRYTYRLHFRLYKNGEKTYLARSIQDSGSGRACSAELDLDAGTYTIYVKISAWRNDTASTAEEVIKRNREGLREKLRAVGNNFDMVHAKGMLRETERAKDKRDKKEEKGKSRKTNVSSRVAKRKERERQKKREERIAKEKERKTEAKKAEKKAKKEKEKKQKQAEEKKTTAEPETSAEGTTEASDRARSTLKSETTEVCSKSRSKSREPKPKSDAVPKDDETSKGISAGATNDTTKKPEDAKQAESTETTKVEDSTDKKDSPESEGSKDWIPVTKPESEDKPPASGSSPKHEDSPAKHAGSHSTRITTTVVTEVAENGEVEVKQEPAAEEQAQGDDDDDDAVSEVSEPCDDDFEWDSEIDGSVAEESDSEIEVDDLYEDKPWNAFCTIGMKVCCIGANAEIEVLHDEDK